MQKDPLLDTQEEGKSKARDSKVVVLLKVLVGLASLYTLYFAQSIIIPLVISAFVALLLSPLVRKLKRNYIPRSISAIILLVTLIAPFTILSIELAEPIERWMKLLPKLSVQVTQQINEFNDAFEAEKESLEKSKKESSEGFFSGWFSSDDEPAPKEDTAAVVEEKIKQGSFDIFLILITAAPIFLAQLFACLILILFLLIFGPPLFKVFVNDFPIVENKKKVTVLVKSIQQELSKYILTISLINICLGSATAAGLFLFGIQDYLLWGAIVCLFNFVPYVGSAFSVLILCVVGSVQFGMSMAALLPPGIFLLLNIAESQIITPAILGRSMQVNPLVIILWLSVAGWLWGVLGMLLAVPLLVCVKLALEQMKISPHWLKLIEANDESFQK